MIKNSEVINSWLNGTPAQGSHLRTDGSDLFSYRLLIGRTTGNVRKHKVVYNYTSNGQYKISKTTTQHVNLAIKAGVKVKNPTS